MEEFFKTAALVIAVVTGLLSLSKGALELLKEYQTSKLSLSMLLSRRQFWMAAGFALVGISLFIGGVW